jgi:predicted ATPase
LIGFLLDQTPTASLLVLLTCRSHFQPAWHHRSYLTEITVNRLSQPQIERMTTDLAGGKPLPVQVLAQITEKTDGVPLFVEEITKAILESGQLTVVDGHYELIGSFSTFAILATLQDSLMARLDRLVTAGIHLRWDNWASVRYAEELNSGKSSVTLQRADRHGILGQKPSDCQVSV